jgi:hypothetical protein
MRQADVDRMMATLMGGAGGAGLRVRRALELMCYEDVKALEPIIEEIIAREVQAATGSRRTVRGTSRVLQSSPRRERRGER